MECAPAGTEAMKTALPDPTQGDPSRPVANLIPWEAIQAGHEGSCPLPLLFQPQQVLFGNLPPPPPQPGRGVSAQASGALLDGWPWSVLDIAGASEQHCACIQVYAQKCIGCRQ